MEVPAAAEGLYALPPPRFTAERDALARALASRDDPAAGPVRRLRRPTGLAWVLNRLARERAADLRALLAAGDRLRTGQRRALSGGGSGPLREAEGEVREKAAALAAEGVRILAAEAKPASRAVHGRLELLLRVAAAAPGPVRDELRRGTLAHEPGTATLELGGLSLVASGVNSPARPDPSPAPLGGGGSATGARRDRRGGRVSRPPPRPEAAAQEARLAKAASIWARRERRDRERELARLRRQASAASARALRAERAAADAEARAARARSRAASERARAERIRALLEERQRG